MGTNRSESTPIDADGAASILDSVDDHDRGLSDAVIGAAAATALVPFLQAVAVKSGEDLYSFMKRLFTKQDGRRSSEEEIVILDDSVKAALRVPPTLRQADLADVGRLLELADGREWVLVSREPSGTEWTLRILRARPESGVVAPLRSEIDGLLGD
jgi:hypothetical protein